MNNPSTHPMEDRLAAFSRGILPEDEAAEIEDHLASCSACLERAENAPIDDRFVTALRSAREYSTSSSSPPVAGRQVPTGYELLETVGRGGMGVVYKAKQRSLGRVVALKQIRAGLDADECDVARFLAEAEAMARLRHPNILQVFDVGRHEGLPFLAMEFLEGGSLGARLRNGPLDPREAARLTETIARAVDHAHLRGIIHRDLTPANILFNAEGVPKVADFGLAKRLDDETSRTGSGVLMGTPSYMSPEQTGGSPAGPSADLYALGAVLYECLTGRPPFRAATVLETLRQVQSLDPPLPNRLQPGTPLDIQTIALRCLEKDPRRRYASASDLADDLARFLRDEPIHARPSGPLTRLGKWTRREPSLAILLVTVLSVVTGAVWGLLAHQARLQVEVERANREASLAKRKSELAESNYREARDAIQKILDWREEPSFAGVPRRIEIHHFQVEKALSFYEKVLAADLADSTVRRDSAFAGVEAATFQIQVGREEDARRILERSGALFDVLIADSPNDRELLGGRLNCWVKLGKVLSTEEPTRALALFQKSREQAELLATQDPTSFQARSNLAWCEFWIGTIHYLQKRRPEAKPHLLKAAAIDRSLLSESPSDPRRADRLAGTLIQMAEVDRLSGRIDEAEAALDEAAASLETALLHTKDLTIRENLAQLHLASGNLALGRRRFDQALKCYERGIPVIESVLGEEPNIDQYRSTCISLHGSRANVVGPHHKRYDDAATEIDRVLELERVPSARARFLILRAYWRLHSSNRAKAIADVEACDRELFEASPGIVKPPDAYNVACVFSLASKAAGEDPTVTEPDRSNRARSLGDKALAWLRRAGDADFFADPAIVANADRDADLDAVRDRNEFASLIHKASNQ